MDAANDHRARAQALRRWRKGFGWASIFCSFLLVVVVGSKYRAPLSDITLEQAHQSAPAKEAATAAKAAEEKAAEAKAAEEIAATEATAAKIAVIMAEVGGGAAMVAIDKGGERLAELMHHDQYRQYQSLSAAERALDEAKAAEEKARAAERALDEAKAAEEKAREWQIIRGPASPEAKAAEEKAATAAKAAEEKAAEAKAAKEVVAAAEAGAAEEKAARVKAAEEALAEANAAKEVAAAEARAAEEKAARAKAVVEVITRVETVLRDFQMLIENSAASEAEREQLRTMIEMAIRGLQNLMNTRDPPAGEATIKAFSFGTGTRADVFRPGQERQSDGLGATSAASVRIAAGAVAISLLGFLSTTVMAWRGDRRAMLADARAQEEHGWKRAERRLTR